ncbi:nuclear receptor subfamily 4 group A member 3-like, partial [Oncorhynchus tshawytscha]|uniref:nuclear receptor subfamily 4 group A member 3-like n=1 Tax=Oncorhynchus tshawytscha TaxID=74940 RepID=UPI001C3D7055
MSPGRDGSENESGEGGLVPGLVERISPGMDPDPGSEERAQPSSESRLPDSPFEYSPLPVPHHSRINPQPPHRTPFSARLSHQIYGILTMNKHAQFLERMHCVQLKCTPRDMPCVQAQYGPAPPGSSYSAQSFGYQGDSYSSDLMTPDYSKLDLGGGEISAAATTSLPSFNVFVEGSYEPKSSCLYQMPSHRPLIKKEEESYPQSDTMPTSSMYFKQSPPATPTTPSLAPQPGSSFRWDDSPHLSHGPLKSARFPHFYQHSPPHSGGYEGLGGGLPRSSSSSSSSSSSVPPHPHGPPLEQHLYHLHRGVGGPGGPGGLAFRSLALGSCNPLLGDRLPSPPHRGPPGEGTCAVCGDNAACQHYGV